MTELMNVFTDDEVESLNAYQDSGIFHPFTCEGCGVDLVASVTGWSCTRCFYRQLWAHDWMKDWSWLRYAPPFFSLNPAIERKRLELIGNLPEQGSTF